MDIKQKQVILKQRHIFMIRNIAFTLTLLGLLITATAAVSAENGAENMELYGGTRGKVPFPHRAHQEVLGDCKKCHDLFPQERGAIERLKKAGELKKKQVMNKNCVKCHRTMKKSRVKAGPVTCAKCHIRG